MTSRGVGLVAPSFDATIVETVNRSRLEGDITHTLIACKAKNRVFGEKDGGNRLAFASEAIEVKLEFQENNTEGIG